MKTSLRLAVITAALATFGAGAHAQETIRIGLVAPFSGPYADYGKQMEAGMKVYMRQHGDSVAGKKVEILVRDTSGANPEVAKRLTQELVARDKVDFLAGYGFTPDALAAAPVAQQSKTPLVILNAAGSVIPSKSNYVTRVSMTIAQNSAPMASWALKNGIRKVVTLVADFNPGIDAATRDIVQTVYVRKVEKVNGKLANVEFDKFPNVKDPGL